MTIAATKHVDSWYIFIYSYYIFIGQFSFRTSSITLDFQSVKDSFSFVDEFTNIPNSNSYTLVSYPTSSYIGETQKQLKYRIFQHKDVFYCRTGNRLTCPQNSNIRQHALDFSPHQTRKF